MLLKGVIVRMISPWASPVVVVPKPDGTWRFCVSYVKLNSITKKDAYPLPRADSLPAFLKGKCWFTALDLLSGFWQVPLPEDAQLKTGFVCHRGQFVFRVCPFGLANAPAMFSRMMDAVLSDLLHEQSFVFIDDCCTASITFSDHLTHVRNVFQRFASHNLKIKLKKCQMFKTQINYLGHVFSAEGVRPLDRNLQGIRDFATPKSVKNVRSFLGMIGYYRDHIPNFADTAAPLFWMLRKGVVFRESWGAHQLRAYITLKSQLLNAPLLKYPNHSLPFILTVDTSDFATGAVLSQEFPVPTHVKMTQITTTLTPSQQQAHIRSRILPNQLSLFDGLRDPISN